jgi:hypothetical protein
VIRIRYKDFSSGTHHVTGFHGKAELSAHGVTVYLLPGMTRWQRKAVLRRLRMEASRGYGPALPLSQLAFALAVDRLRTAVRITAGAVRLHPSQTLLPTAAAALLMAFFMLASAGSRMQLAPRTGLDGMVSARNAAVAAAPPAARLDVRPAQFGPIVGGRSGTVAAGLPAGQWGVKSTALWQIAAAGQGSGTRLGSPAGAQAADPRRDPGLRVERACFGAMPGLGSPGAVQLACRP